MLKFFNKKKKVESEVKKDNFDAFKTAEAKFTGPQLAVNEALNIAYNNEAQSFRDRFELLNESYNQLLRVEKVKKQKQDITNKVVARKKFVERIPTKKIYEVPKVKARPNPDLVFDIHNLDEYFAQAIHGVISRHIIDQEIQNEISEIRMQMASAKANLNFDRRKYDQDIPALKSIQTPDYSVPSAPKDNSQILEDVFSELDSLLKGDKAYVINGQASIVRARKQNQESNELKKAIKNIRV